MSDTTAPTSVRRAAALLLTESVLLTLGALAYGVADVLGNGDEVVAGVGSAVMLLLLAGVLALLARGVAGLRGWARTPALLLQTISVPVALAILEAGRPLLALGVVALPVAVLVLMLRPDARTAFPR